MDSPAKDIERYNTLLEEAHSHLAAKAWVPARTAIEQAIAIDRLQTKPYELLAEVYDATGENEQANVNRLKAKAIREERWKREVEAEARGRHDMLGEASRHEIP